MAFNPGCEFFHVEGWLLQRLKCLRAKERVSPLLVVHVMRTYGDHGGENQLASYLAAASSDDAVNEGFAFVFRDETCRALFVERGVCASLYDLWRFQQSTGGAWREVVSVLVRLPVLQWRLGRLLSRLDPQVCVVHGVQAALVAWPFAILRRLHRRRFVYVHRTTKASGRAAVARLLYRPFDVLAGNSRAVAKSLLGLTDVDRIIALENGVDLDRLASRAAQSPAAPIPASSVDLIAVGRLLAHKNQRLVIDALAAVVQEYPETTLWIVGSGSEQRSLEDHVRLLGLEGNVVFLGQRSDVPALLARARIFVNASSWEGMSNAVLEAMAMGMPSVIVDAPGVTECHEVGVTGTVVQKDAKIFAAAVLAYLRDAEKAELCGRRARERVNERYSIAAARQRYLDLYHRLAEQDA